MGEKKKICPVCKEPVDPKEGIYRVRGDDYHRKCFEKHLGLTPTHSEREAKD